MSRRCELTGKGPMSGNNVSHAKNRTRRDHRGGLDAFMAKAKDGELSASALKVKKEITKVTAA